MTAPRAAEGAPPPPRQKQPPPRPLFHGGMGTDPHDFRIFRIMFSFHLQLEITQILIIAHGDTEFLQDIAVIGTSRVFTHWVNGCANVLENVVA